MLSSIEIYFPCESHLRPWPCCCVCMCKSHSSSWRKIAGPSLLYFMWLPPLLPSFQALPAALWLLLQSPIPFLASSSCATVSNIIKDASHRPLTTANAMRKSLVLIIQGRGTLSKNLLSGLGSRIHLAPSYSIGALLFCSHSAAHRMRNFHDIDWLEKC